MIQTAINKVFRFLNCKRLKPHNHENKPKKKNFPFTIKVSLRGRGGAREGRRANGFHVISTWKLKRQPWHTLNHLVKSLASEAHRDTSPPSTGPQVYTYTKFRVLAWTTDTGPNTTNSLVQLVGTSSIPDKMTDVHPPISRITALARCRVALLFRDTNQVNCLTPQSQTLTAMTF